MPNGYNNTVPLGRAGTGNAVIYGDNPVASQYANQLAALRQRQYQDYQLQQKAAEDQAKEWKDNQLAVKGGLLWADQIAKLEQDHFNEGASLKQKGIDPYGTSPEALDYRRKRLGVESMQQFRGGMEDRAKLTDKRITDHPDDVDPEDVKNYHNFWKNTTLEDAYKKNLLPPEVRNRFKVDEALKGIQAVTKETKDLNGKVISEVKSLDKDATEAAILGTLSSDPRGIDHIKQITSGVALKDLKDYSVDPETNKKNLAEYISGNPKKRYELAQMGIAPNSPEMKALIDDTAIKQAQAKKKYDDAMGLYVARSAEGMNFFNKNTPYTNQEDLARLRASLRPPKQSGGGTGGSPDVPRNVPLYFGKDQNSGEQPSVMGKNTMNFTKPKMNFGGSVAIDTKTGRPTKLVDSTSDYEIARFADYPVATKDIIITKTVNGKKVTERIEKGSLVQDKYAENNPSGVTYKSFAVAQKPDKFAPSGYKTYLIESANVPTNSFTKNDMAAFNAFNSIKREPTTSNVPPKSGSASFTVNGKRYDIPADKVDSFKKSFPSAKRL